ncbi:MAG: hypothetical protein ACI9MR_003170 [Myxococcota bacterium]|jgi:hypothetical protein
MPHYATLLKRGAPFAKSFTVRADSYAESTARVVFYREGRVVHQVPRPYVLAIETFESALGANDRLDDHRRSLVGGATTHVEESGSVGPRQRRRQPGANGPTNTGTAIPAEGISFRINE